MSFNYASSCLIPPFKAPCGFPQGYVTMFTMWFCKTATRWPSAWLIEENRNYLKGGIFWSGFLRPLGVPLPDLLHANGDAQPFGYMVLERLGGTDLCHVYSRLDGPTKRKLAEELAPIQLKMASLPRGAGYGHATGMDGPFPYDSWPAAMEGNLLRSRRWTEAAGILSTEHFQKVERLLTQHKAYLSSIAPIAFLDDITTKNVLLKNGKLTGIVDVDEVCFGDSLFSLALTRMALLAHEMDTDYIEYWKAALGWSPGQNAILDLYTAMHCCGFLGEVGQQFNRAAPEPVDRAYLARLMGILDELTAQL